MVVEKTTEWEAAAEIERLTEENIRLRRALEEIATTPFPSDAVFVARQALRGAE